MKYILFLMPLILIGCSTPAGTDLFTGSWISTGSETSMLFLHPDSTCTFYKKVGSPWAEFWEGYWRAESNNIFILDKGYAPVAAANLTGYMRFKIMWENEYYYFHRYGAFPTNGGP
jgi:hypothetical protein